MASNGTSLASLAALLRDGENVIAPHVVDSDEDPALGALAAAGPRAAEAPDEYLLLVEAIREGYLLHYGSPRLIQGADEDLRLLAGDYLYALGLERLAGLGDLPAVRELSDLISLGAQLNAEDPGPPPPRAGEALWLASATAITARDGEALADAKLALRAGNRGAEAALDAAAAEIAARAGIVEALSSARIAIDSRQSDAPELG
jgi:hypothetical protein